MYNEQGKFVAEHYHSLADRAALFAHMEFYVNVLSLVFQAVVVPGSRAVAACSSACRPCRW